MSISLYNFWLADVITLMSVLQLSIKKLSGGMNFLNQSQPAKVNHRDPELLLPVN